MRKSFLITLTGALGSAGTITLRDAGAVVIWLLTVACLVPVVVIRWRKLLEGRTVETRDPFKDESGLAPIFIILMLAGAGLGLWAAKPKAIHGESRRADASATATANLEKASDKPAAEAASSVVAIGNANAAAPASPQKNFIAREVPVALAKLPAFDPSALVEAEKRRAAVEGKLEEVEKLYGQAMQRADLLQKEKTLAVEQRREVDDALVIHAAESRATERQRDLAVLAVLGAVVLYLYTKYTHVSPATIATMVRNVESGMPAIQAIDGPLSEAKQRLVAFAKHLKS